VDGGAPDAEVDPAARHAEGCVDVEADPQPGPPGRRDDVVDQVELRRRVDHEGDPSGCLLVGGELTERGPVHRRIGDDDVAAHRAVATGQPQRLRQRVGQHAGEARPGEYAPQDAAVAHRLAGDADGLARGAADEVVGVGVQRIEIQHGEGWIDGCGRVVQPGPLLLVRGRGEGDAHRGERAVPAVTGSR
jgi:hypothetical protein